MIDALTTAVIGLNSAASRIADATQVIVNASSISENALHQTSQPTDSITLSTHNDTGGTADMTAALVAIQADSILYGANAAVVRAVKKTNESLVNIIT